MAKYVDFNGVKYLWTQIVAKATELAAAAAALVNVTYDTTNKKFKKGSNDLVSAATIVSDANGVTSSADLGSGKVLLGAGSKTAQASGYEIGGSTLSSTGNKLATEAAVNTALGGYIPTSQKDAANGVAPLDANSKVPVGNLSIPAGTTQLAGLDSTNHIPAQYLPSYVDDVIELRTFAANPTSITDPVVGDKYYNTSSKGIYTYDGSSWGPAGTGETPEKGKIYVRIDTNESYRWGGSEMVEIANLDAAVQGLSSGTTTGHIVTWGIDGYHVADSGKTVSELDVTLGTGADISAHGAVINLVDGSSNVKSHLNIVPDQTTGDNIEINYDTSTGSILLGTTATADTYLPTTGTGSGVESIEQAIAEAEAAMAAA